ncbi:tyrosine-type recombinase/integrase [Marinobacter sp.]|uniref:phage integrase n=1 Tax=Marinobacter sp. TaxID=50741 RepID=UPI0019B4719D|nr:tyrosine-type recombinase/integrase [Marinobacter sp.]MBD3657798.1 tyrosine-type recombinase/integrase [Marinobacter sp.]
MISKGSHGWSVDWYPQGRGGPRVRKRGFKTRLDALAFVRDYGSQTVQRDTKKRLSDLVNTWYELHGHTLKDCKYRLSRTLAITDRLGNPRVSDFTASDWLEYRAQRLKSVTASTINHEQRYLAAVFSECQRLGICQDNPLSKVRQVRTAHHEMMFLSLVQCRQLLEQCRQSSNPHTWAVAVICLATGARWGEAEALTTSGWLPGKLIYRDTKNGKDRAVPISQELQSDIEQVALPGPGRMFGSCRYAFRAAYERCGFNTPQQLTHILRHTFASHYMMNGGDLLTLQRILGHGSITMTMRYAHLSPEHLESARELNPLKLLGSQHVVKAKKKVTA